MLNEKEIIRIYEMKKKNKTIRSISRKTGHSKTTIQKYLKNSKAAAKQPRTWLTRSSPFEEVKDEIQVMFRITPALEGKTLLEYLIQKYPDKFSTKHLRSLQRYLKILRVTIGPSKEVMFEQEHPPGETSASDFTHMNDLEILIKGESFPHMLYHFTLLHSRWEWGRICFSESLESFRLGFQECVSQLNGVTREHLTDSLSAAVHNLHTPGTFKDRYQELLTLFQVKGRRTQPRSPNENGGIEQRHHRLKRTIEQELLLRRTRCFETVDEYKRFLHRIFEKLNASRQEAVEREKKTLQALPNTTLIDYTIERPRVSAYSTIRVRSCICIIEVWYAQKLILTCQRQQGRSKHCIDYRHFISSLRKKPGAFQNYRYRESCYPTTTFRLIYDYFLQHNALKSSKIYLDILWLTMQVGEERMENVLSHLLKQEEEISYQKIEQLANEQAVPDRTEVHIPEPDLSAYDQAFCLGGMTCSN